MSFSYLSEGYAGILMKTDVITLFDYLIEDLGGNRIRAARKAGLTGKATYDWENASYIKTNTKQGVLEACLDVNFRRTIEYLLDRCGERTVDILRTTLASIYEEALLTQSRESFEQLITEFWRIKTQYRGTIRDNFEIELDEISLGLENKAQELSVPLPAKTINDFSSEELLNQLPLIRRELEINIENPEVAVRNLELPREMITTFWSTFETFRTNTIGQNLPELESAEGLDFMTKIWPVRAHEDMESERFYSYMQPRSNTNTVLVTAT